MLDDHVTGKPFVDRNEQSSFDELCDEVALAATKKLAATRRPHRLRMPSARLMFFSPDRDRSNHRTRMFRLHAGECRVENRLLHANNQMVPTGRHTRSILGTGFPANRSFRDNHTTVHGSNSRRRTRDRSAAMNASPSSSRTASTISCVIILLRTISFSGRCAAADPGVRRSMLRA